MNLLNKQNTHKVNRRHKNNNTQTANSSKHDISILVVNAILNNKKRQYKEDYVYIGVVFVRSFCVTGS